MRIGTIGTTGWRWGINSDCCTHRFKQFSNCFVSVPSGPLLILNMFIVNYVINKKIYFTKEKDLKNECLILIS